MLRLQLIHVDKKIPRYRHLACLFKSRLLAQLHNTGSSLVSLACTILVSAVPVDGLVGVMGDI